MYVCDYILVLLIRWNSIWVIVCVFIHVIYLFMSIGVSVGPLDGDIGMISDLFGRYGWFECKKNGLFCYWLLLILFQQEMGVYLSSPKTDKASQDGENDKLRYGLSSMQGWRTTMEDAVSTLYGFLKLNV